ncbi:cysteine synthase isoform X1 [Iris pallida]|uniref:Cysteine synthase isoform X1 n=1 Tax=Iris pallida TaxID=29817 RepID=A0AAX6H6Y7_IRIPA|nr:cysteine synthase isoform X1 [Iris pallida]
MTAEYIDRANIRKHRIEMASISAMKGYKLIPTMPSYMTLKRRVTMRAFVVNLVFTNPAKGMGGKNTSKVAT